MKKFVIFLITLNLIYVNGQDQSMYNKYDPENLCVSAEVMELYELVNAYRKKNKLPPISLSKALCHVAQVHAEDMEYNMKKLKEKYFILFKDNWVRNNPDSVNDKILNLREYISNLKVEIYSEFKKDDVEKILARKEFEELLSQDLSQLSEKRILITGSEGSIGKKLNQILINSEIKVCATDIVGENKIIFFSEIFWSITSFVNSGFNCNNLSIRFCDSDIQFP